MLGNVLGTVEVEMRQAIVPIFEDLTVSGETDTQAHSMRGMRKHSKRSMEVCRRSSQCTGPAGKGQVGGDCSVTVVTPWYAVRGNFLLHQRPRRRTRMCELDKGRWELW